MFTLGLQRQIRLNLLGETLVVNFVRSLVECLFSLWTLLSIVTPPFLCGSPVNECSIVATEAGSVPHVLPNNRELPMLLSYRAWPVASRKAVKVLPILVSGTLNIRVVVKVVKVPWIPHIFSIGTLRLMSGLRPMRNAASAPFGMTLQVHMVVALLALKASRWKRDLLVSLLVTNGLLLGQTNAFLGPNFLKTLTPVPVTLRWSLRNLRRSLLTKATTVTLGPVNWSNKSTLLKPSTFTLSISIRALLGTLRTATGTLTLPPQPFLAPRI